MSLPATENFTGAAGVLRGVWTPETATSFVEADGAGVGTVTITDAVNGAAAYYNAERFTPDQYSKVIVRNVSAADGAYAGVSVRRTLTPGGSNGYSVLVDGSVVSPNHTIITRSDNGSALILTSLAQAWVNGDELRLDVVGTVLNVKRNGVSIGTYDTAGDPTKYAYGYAGLRPTKLGLGGASNPTFDDWEGGNLQPRIDSQSNDQTVNEGQDATYTVTATSSGGTLHYQWKFNGSNVGSDSNSYTRTGCVLADSGGTVTCTVTDDNGSSTSLTVNLTVLHAAQPWNYAA